MPSVPPEADMHTGHPDRRRLVFGDFEVDLQRGCLKQAGKEISLRPKSFAVLQYLLEHAGQLVAREEIMSAVWPETAVTDDSLAQCLIELRKALGDNSRSMIRTVPRRGLIFDAPARIEETAGAPATPRLSSPGVRRGWIFSVALMALAALLLWWANMYLSATQPSTEAGSTRAAHSIAVLRFTDMSPGGDQAYLGDGISEEIMHRLAQIPSLRVIARVSSFAVEGQPAAEIARQLDVSYILEGSVRREGDAVRVTAQLVDAGSSSHIWSKTYDRDLDDILGVEQEIAGSVADSLEVSLAGTDDMQSIDPRAHELVLEGRYFYLRRADGDLQKAQERYQQALKISPGFARAWVGLAAVANASRFDEGPQENRPANRQRILETQRQAVEEALRLGPNLPEAHIRAAYYYYQAGNRKQAREHFEIARSRDPDHWLVRTMLANELRISGRIEESIALFQHEVQRDPLNIVLRENLVSFLVWAKRFEDAQAELDSIKELMPSMPDRSRALSAHAVRVQILLGDMDGAAVAVESLAHSQERDKLLAMIQYALGHQAESNTALQHLATGESTAWNALHAAEVYAYRGESPEAMNRLRSIEYEPGCRQVGFAQNVYYSPFLDMLSENPAWEEYRSGVLEYMQGCLLGLDVDSI